MEDRCAPFGRAISRVSAYCWEEGTNSEAKMVFPPVALKERLSDEADCV
jgi:hypothetical protein